MASGTAQKEVRILGSLSRFSDPRVLSTCQRTAVRWKVWRPRQGIYQQSYSVMVFEVYMDEFTLTFYSWGTKKFAKTVFEAVIFFHWVTLIMCRSVKWRGHQNGQYINNVFKVNYYASSTEIFTNMPNDCISNYLGLFLSRMISFWCRKPYLHLCPSPITVPIFLSWIQPFSPYGIAFVLWHCCIHYHINGIFCLSACQCSRSIIMEGCKYETVCMIICSNNPELGTHKRNYWQWDVK